MDDTVDERPHSDATAGEQVGRGVPAFPSRARRRLILQAMLIASDTLMLFGAGLLATWVRFGRIRHVAALPQLGPRATFAWLSVLLVAVWLVAIAYEHLYDLQRVFWGTGEYARMVRALTLGVVAFILVTYLLKLQELSRLWTLLAWTFACVLTVVGRALVRHAVAASRRRGRLLRPALIVGYNAEAADLMRVLRGNTSSGLVPVGCLASAKSEQLGLDYCSDGVPLLGSAGEIREVVDELYIDAVVIASTAFDHEVVARIINELRGRNVEINLSSGLLDVSTSRVLVREVSGIPLITLRGVAFTPARRLVKRTFDLVLGGLIVLVGLPVWLLVAAAIVLESRGPVFYRQERIGREGKPFKMLKFRSMCADAEARLAEVRAANEATGPLFKMREDPRVTRVGALLRRFSIDEFPQLINVMLGEMSLVGPRPPLVSEASQYSEHHWRRMEVLPGMTGLWQVSGRSELSFDDMVRLDLFYIENWSVGFDVGILLRTLPAVLSARGAY